MSSSNQTGVSWGLLLVTLFVPIGCAGCSALGPTTGSEDRSDAPEPAASAEEPPSLDSIRIEFRNLSSNAVDTQFYVASEPVAALPDGLLIPENLVQAGIGVGGTGILGPLTTDEVDVTCAEQVVVGTGGGEFLDANLGTVLGQGPVRFMQSDFQFDCGAELVFEYTQTDGGFSVTVFQDH
ncbi:MAG: hypothetical protein GY842_04525 [bacterium]|nr:hypothetical protein [bacterium]